MTEHNLLSGHPPLMKSPVCVGVLLSEFPRPRSRAGDEFHRGKRRWPTHPSSSSLTDIPSSGASSHAPLAVLQLGTRVRLLVVNIEPFKLPCIISSVDTQKPLRQRFLWSLAPFSTA
ncbi:hypothetical protein PROFUN_05051 [Planoprotostelium fungivorum]|uniref:Uncharacterized protein n=1 Tax=Planoprotostelium fungivorum TaxID=1890364 RepID=A0A2P6NS93_9EUKA|nr:hypothetical protein PROFUN_05051 [Planoprotostelium fungivorum]